MFPATPHCCQLVSVRDPRPSWGQRYRVCLTWMNSSVVKQSSRWPLGTHRKQALATAATRKPQTRHVHHSRTAPHVQPHFPTTNTHQRRQVCGCGLGAESTARDAVLGLKEAPHPLQQRRVLRVHALRLRHTPALALLGATASNAGAAAAEGSTLVLVVAVAATAEAPA